MHGIRQQDIRICRDANVLSEYLGNRESEVVDIMMQLYDDEEIMRMHDRALARDSEIRGAVGAYQEVGMTFEKVAERIAKKFSLSHEDAEEEVKEYWDEGSIASKEKV